jgi:hypothetical protein
MTNMNDLDRTICIQAVKYLVSEAPDYPHPDSGHRGFDRAVGMPLNMLDRGVDRAGRF